MKTMNDGDFSGLFSPEPASYNDEQMLDPDIELAPCRDLIKLPGSV